MTPSTPFDDAVWHDTKLFPDKWEDRIRSFERAWLAGKIPDLANYLPEDITARSAILPQLVLADLEFRLKRREPARVETYLQRFPELHDDLKGLREFLATEFRIRRRFEPLLSVSEYQQRFPHLASLASFLEEAAQAAPETKIFSPRATHSESESLIEKQTPSRGDSIARIRHLENPFLETGHQAEWSDLEIREKLGHGGMGTVYLAWQRSLERWVAVKVLRTFTDLPANAHRRFRREAVTAAQLHHPNIVQVFAFGEVGGIPFYVMEYVAGGSLAQRLMGTPCAPRESAQLIEVVARALHVAHQQQLLHRDLKPGNILLSPDGTPKLGDFGLVLKLDEETRQTSAEVLLGTLRYMAPEQALTGSGHLTSAADVYSLGAVLYELLTGQPPLAGGTSLEMLEQLRTRDPVTPRRHVPKLDTDLETICLKCLRKEPTARYASAWELAEDLRRFLGGQPILARRYRPWNRFLSWCRRQPALAATSLTLFVAIMGLGLLLPKSRASSQHALDAKRRLSEVRSVFRRSHTALQTRLDKLTSKIELRRAQSHYETFLTEHANDDELMTERASAHFGLGTVLHLLGESTAGIEQWHVAQQLFDQSLSKLDTYDPWSLYWMTAARLNVFMWHRSQGRLDEAWTTLEQGSRLLELLAARNPTNLTIKYCRAWCDSKYGALGQKNHRPEEALVYCERAIAIWRNLVTVNMVSPLDSNRIWSAPRTRLCQALNYSGLTLQSLERHEESLSRFQELLTLAETVPPLDAEESDGQCRWQKLKRDAHHGLARGHYMIGKQLLNDARPELAVGHFQESIDHWSAVVDFATASASQRSYLASSHFHLAIAHRRQGHRPEAEVEYQRAIELWKSLLANQTLNGFNRELAQRHLAESYIELRKLRDMDAVGN